MLSSASGELRANHQLEEFTFSGPNSFRLLGRLWRTQEQARGTVFGCHGYTEHSGRYGEFARFLNGHSLNLALFDLPGHGLSSGRRANIDCFEDYQRCLENFFKEIRAWNVSGPFYLFGHSLGGLISTRFLQTSELAKEVSRAAVTCPLLGLSTHSFHGVGHLAESRFGSKILRWLCEVLPNVTLPNKKDLGGGVLTHDPEMEKLRQIDPLIKPTVTIHFTREFLRAIDCAFSDASKLTTPFLILRADDDMVVSVNAQKKFFDQLSLADKKFVNYPGMWHELLNETIREKVKNEILTWYVRP